jgi:hypothetical protein
MLTSSLCILHVNFCMHVLNCHTIADACANIVKCKRLFACAHPALFKHSSLQMTYLQRFMARVKFESFQIGSLGPLCA